VSFQCDDRVPIFDDDNTADRRRCLGTLPRMTKPSIWSYGKFVLGCGTFGGIGGSPKLVRRGLDEPAAFATMDEAVGLGITLFDTAARYARGASESMIGRWLLERDSAITATWADRC
jgi:aryl-alcohol dehydrogenase-like predicted oxidoreductase